MMTMNFSSAIVLILILAAAVGAAVYGIRNGDSCGGSCANCRRACMEAAKVRRKLAQAQNDKTKSSLAVSSVISARKEKRRNG